MPRSRSSDSLLTDLTKEWRHEAPVSTSSTCQHLQHLSAPATSVSTSSTCQHLQHLSAPATSVSVCSTCSTCQHLPHLPSSAVTLQCLNAKWTRGDSAPDSTLQSLVFALSLAPFQTAAHTSLIVTLQVRRVVVDWRGWLWIGEGGCGLERVVVDWREWLWIGECRLVVECRV
jgi:hypothetical protein